MTDVQFLSTEAVGLLTSPVTGRTVASTVPTRWPRSADLALDEDIRANGVLTPLSVAGGYLHDGHHRYWSAMRLGLKEVPVRYEMMRVFVQFKSSYAVAGFGGETIVVLVNG